MNREHNSYNISRHLMNAVETTEEKAGAANWLEIVRRQVASLRFGVVQIVVHDSQVTQIDKTERVRLKESRSQKF